MDRSSSLRVAAHPSRAYPRVLLVLVACALALLLALSGVWPSGVATNAFAQTTGPAIELLNPDASTSTELSGKNDGENTTYHLAAWVANAPAVREVQFKFTADGDNQPVIPIDCAETGSQSARAATADTYECSWNPHVVDDGTGTLRAELYDENGTKLTEDEESVTIDSEGQTVELVYPRHGETVGFYTGPDGLATGMVAVTASASGTPEGDEGTQVVEVFYSMAPPGAAPAFETCGREDVTGGSREAIRCDLAEDNPDTVERENDPGRITAIAAVPRDTTEGTPEPGVCTTPDVPLCDQEDIDAADAHRAFGYEQEAASVQLAPQTHEAMPASCSQVVTAKVLDEEGRAIVGINVDVKAQGPTDNLFFDDDDDADGNTSRSQAPSNHETEAAIDCEDDAPPPAADGSQGIHRSEAADVKHIESSDDTGTDENGEFRFQLYSVDAGGTQLTAWADSDGDDVYCSAETSANGSIGWNQGAPAPAGVASETCPTPTGSQTPTQSPTSTGTTTTGPTSDRTLTLSIDRPRIVAGRRVSLQGQIFSNDPSCADAQEFVRIRRRMHGTNRFRNLTGVNTDGDGRYTVLTRQRRNADFVAIAPAHDHCRRSSSAPVTLLVKVKMKIAASATRPNRGDLVRIKSSVRPHHDGTRLVLQRKKGQRWVRFMVRKLNRRSIASYVFPADFRVGRFRTRWKSQSARNQSNTSRVVTIRTR